MLNQTLSQKTEHLVPSQLKVYCLKARIKRAVALVWADKVLIQANNITKKVMSYYCSYCSLLCCLDKHLHPSKNLCLLKHTACFMDK